MDDFLRVPGTKLRFGLDPIIGLLPGIGDVTSAIVSAVAFVHAARSGVPKILLARMAMNILINELVGIIPGLGDAFSFWFKSNVRNYELLRRLLCRARAIEKRRLDICHRSSQSAVCYCLRGIDRDRPRIGGYWAFPLPPISHCKGVNRPTGIDVSFSKSIEFVIAKTNNKLSVFAVVGTGENQSHPAARR